MNKLKIIMLCIAICLLTSCTSKTKPTQNVIYLGEKSDWLPCQEDIKIEDTKDILTIDTPLDNWKLGDGNVTVSFTQKVEYTIQVDGVNYQGAVVFSSDEKKPKKDEDGNPNYDIQLVNFRKKAVQVIIKTKLN